ncbi:MAG: carbon storage regulator, partial [Litorivicinus sp.]
GSNIMLVLTRRLGEKIVVDSGRVIVKVLGFHGKSVRLGLEADEDTRILRAELSPEAMESMGGSADDEDVRAER